jgi:homoserine O-acetyltransferase
MHHISMRTALIAIFVWSAVAQAQSPEPIAATDGEWIVTDFRFHTGEVLQQLRLQYSTVGDPTGEPVLILHGSGGNRRQFLDESFAGELFGPGQPLDASRYFIIIPDNIGHGGSSKPSDGLRAQFPKYNYGDMVRAQYRLITEHLGISRLRLIIGGSMGGMHAWMWGEMYPDFVDALMPLQCLPVEIAGINRMLRRAIVDSIRSDPAWQGGEYDEQPRDALTSVAYIELALFADPIAMYRSAPTLAQADEAFESVPQMRQGADANDLLYVYEASRDYNPEPHLEEIRARVFAINTADDSTNPPDLNVLPRLISRVQDGRYILIPRTAETVGHGSYRQGRLYAEYITEILR